MKKLLVLLLTLCTVFSFAACGGAGDTSEESSFDITSEDSSTPNDDLASDSDLSVPDTDTSVEAPEEPTVAFTVTVVDRDGNPVVGAGIQVCKEACYVSVTNEKGVATFTEAIGEGYSISVLACPAGYTVDNTVYAKDENGMPSKVALDSGITEYTVEIIKG